MEQDHHRRWEEVEDDDDDPEVSLQGRQSRHHNNNSPTASTIAISSDSKANASTSNDNDPIAYSRSMSATESESYNGEEEGLEIKVLNDSNNNHLNNTKDVNECGDRGAFTLHNSVDFDKHQDAESIHGDSGVEGSIVEKSFGGDELDAKVKKFDIQSPSTETSDQFGEIKEDEIFYGLNLSPTLNSSDKHDATVQDFDSEPRLDAEVGIIEGIDEDIIELDIERVLQKQNTHDLYCPNCNSCITRRVILRRRKPKIRSLRRKVERDVGSQLDANSSRAPDDGGCGIPNICSNGSPTLAADDGNQDREPDIFRCFSCFSFFVPIGNGFRVFRAFGDASENENIQNPENISGAKTNWFFSIFTSDKRKTATGQGDAMPGHSEVDTINQYSDNMPPCSRDDHPIVPLAVRTLINLKDSAEDSQIKTQKSGESLPPTVQLEVRNEKPLVEADHKSSAESFCDVRLVNNKAIESQEYGKNILNSSEKDNILTENVWSNARGISDDVMTKSSTDGAALDNCVVDASEQISSSFSNNMPPQDERGHSETSSTEKTPVIIGIPTEDTIEQVGVKLRISSSSDSFMLKQSQMETEKAFKMEIGNQIPDPNNYAPAIQGAPLSTESIGNGGVINEVTIVHSSTQDLMLPGKVKTDVEEKSADAVNNKITGDDVIVIVERETPSSQQVQNIAVSTEAGIFLTQTETQIHVVEHRRTEVSEAYGIDILKSIVYGGLIESITSLGVVSSAAGAGASTLNILALGLANLVGGIFIIGHNLWELKNDSRQLNEQEDRYQQILGRRENFWVHATIVVLSFIVFGLVPPAVYALSFRKSDDRELKLAAVLGASLVCIVFLAIGKGHIRRPSKAYVKTVMYYVMLVLMGSGVSYIVGVLLRKLLDKLGWLDEYSLDRTTSVVFPEVDRAWASY
ncbi:VIT1 domain-containing protein [Cephalotus follicularis]|uniref:VIT1 domain-containing protein n=1 Tax=Cephalotus follicularis TaxID=3775 RepID=A0A1Q3BM55_CEPFO|nr:VIT1 domain-containing protein [Cephalotus follicularis]